MTHFPVLLALLLDLRSFCSFWSVTAYEKKLGSSAILTLSTARSLFYIVSARQSQKSFVRKYEYHGLRVDDILRLRVVKHMMNKANIQRYLLADMQMF